MSKETIDQEQINAISVKNLAGRVALNLRAAVRSTEDGYELEVKDKKHGNYLRHSLQQTVGEAIVCRILIETGNTKEKIVYSRIDVREIVHLYATWDTPKLVSLCFVRGDRFYLINISSNTSVIMLSGIDRRASEPKNVDPEQMKKRRSFYHVGKIVEEVEEEEVETEDAESTSEEENDEEQDDIAADGPRKGYRATIRQPKSKKIIKG